MKPLGLIFSDIFDERARQNKLKEQGRFPYTCADKELSNFQKASILGEEMGEVHCAALNQAKLSTDSKDRHNLRKELVQVCAVAVAWIEALDNEQPSTVLHSKQD